MAIVTEALAPHQRDTATLAARRKGDAGKVRIAQQLQRETPRTLAQLATRLQPGAKTHLVHLLDWKIGNGVMKNRMKLLTTPFMCRVPFLL